jgi:methionyl-tRNA synthetase
MHKKNYIVTSIPYANGNPHMGHTLDALYGDVLNRYYKMKGADSVLQVGIDEHGQKVYQKAQSEKVSIEDWLKKIRPVFLDFEKKLNIDYQIFTQTSDKENHFPAAQEMWKRAQKNGDIYKKNYKGLYCVGCEAFVTKDDLIDDKCPDHQKEPEELEEENYFFALSKYRKFLKNHFDKYKNFVYPKNYYHEAYNLIDKLEDVSISRPKERLPWGVPVPNDDKHVMYVWFDALINYLSGIGFPNDIKKFNQYWPADIEIIGKDNNRWHSLLWPAMLKSAELDIPKTILIHGHITAKGGVKMSKTIGNVIDPVEVIDKYGADAFRYYLLSRIPLDNDGTFDKDMFHDVYIADLVNGLGNLFQRTLTMINKYNIKIDLNKIDSREDLFRDSIEERIKQFNFMSALELISSMADSANEKIEKGQPWQLAKEDKLEDLKVLLNDIYFILVCISKNIYPFMPETSERMKIQLKTLKPEPLFPRMEK